MCGSVNVFAHMQCGDPARFRQGCFAIVVCMTICLADITALRYWRAVRTGELPAPMPSRANIPERFKASSVVKLRADGRFGIVAGNEALHIGIAGQQGRKAVKGVATHCLAFSPGTPVLRRVNPTLLVLTPESLFFQMARSLTFEALVLFGMELCGSYSLASDGSGSFVSTAPVTTREQLLALAPSASRLPGSTRAIKALRYIADGAASPAEAKLVALLCAKRSMGGYGLPLPKLNFQLNVIGDARKVTERRYFVCDLYWESAKLDVEYDSDAFHASPAGMASDADRRNALSSMGITVVTVTNIQMQSIVEFDNMAQVVARALGIRLRPVAYDWLAACKRLRESMRDAARMLR